MYNLKMLLTVRVLCWDNHSSPNSCLQHGVLALNLLIHWGASAFPSSDEVGTFQPNCSAVQNLDSSFIAWTSKSCCGCSQAQNCVLRHFGPPSLGLQSLAVAAAILKISYCVTSSWASVSSKSFKNDRFHKLFESPPFLSWSIIIDFCSKSSGFISLFGVPLFSCRWLIFTILHISKVILKFCRVYRVRDFV